MPDEVRGWDLQRRRPVSSYAGLFLEPSFSVLADKANMAALWVSSFFKFGQFVTPKEFKL
jgi:hypothetical protein